MTHKLITPDSGPDFILCNPFFASLIHIHLTHRNSLQFCTDRKQVEQVCVGIDVRRCGLDERQFLEDSIQLLGLGQVDPCFLFVNPVWQRHVHGYEVFQVYTQDRESKAGALGEALAVLTVVPT